MSKVKDIWCGYKLNKQEKETITLLVLREFDKMPWNRKSSYLLLRETKMLHRK